MFKSRKFLASIISGFMMFVLALSITSIAKARVNDDQITICHRTNSVTNPYEVKSPNKSGDVNGHADHLGPVFDPNTVYPPPHNGDQWGDIIPPFDYGTGQHFIGLNWTTAGQAIYAAGCNIPGASPSPSSNPSPSPSCSVSPSPSPVCTISPSCSPTPTPTPSGQSTPTPTPTPSGQTTSTPTATPSGGSTSTPTPAGGSTVTTKITPAVLGTSVAVGGSNENLPTTGANDASLYYILTAAFLGLTYYMKVAGWKKIKV